ncbi:unnamed protein product [Clonostachys byssicola]|uniref:Uncharacterized protein n=1 Tax=Clonostachys byssicola TaxID=160290 RepID=A0A9N9U9E9_9HYPO|nr:unnamed protein product [Clonostachys byssicola]
MREPSGADGHSGQEMCLDLYKTVLGRRRTEAIPSSSSCLISVAAATVAPAIEAHQRLETITDEILFSITLPTFTTRRNALDLNTSDWASDGCTSSPDSPLGFPLTPACNRHGFAYNNYRAQTRLTASTKRKIDNNFKKEYVFTFSSSSEIQESLYYQCGKCDILRFVRVFAGGGDVAPGSEMTNLPISTRRSWPSTISPLMRPGQMA